MSTGSPGTVTIMHANKIRFRDELKDLGWAWAILSEDGQSFILVRKSAFGPGVAEGVANHLLTLLRKDQGQ